MTLLKSEKQVDFEDLKQQYTLKRIVYVNSATHGYSEFEIDKHMALFGDNNQGKTASLAGLKLALFPETSFTHCTRKFKFTGKDGDYSKEDSYEFYFPSYQSYIVIEVRNPGGHFCMVLYKAKGEWEYGRYFVPLAYEDIRLLFWNLDANDGEGEFASELSQEKLGPKLKALGGVQATDPKDIADFLFAGHKGDPNQSRFCLCPLSDGSSKAAVDAFRNLYQLAFDIGQTDKQTLPRAIATIIEMRRGRKEERLSADLDQIMAVYEELSNEKNRITRLENCASRWEGVDSTYNHYKELSERASYDISSLMLCLEDEEALLLEAASGIQERYGKAVEKKSVAAARQQEAKTAFDQKQGKLEAAEENEQKIGEDYTAALNLKAQYLETPVHEISAILQEELDGHRNAITTLKSDAQMRVRQQEAIREKNQYTEEARQLNKKLSDNQEGMLDKLSEAEATALYSISSSFGQLSENIDQQAVESAKNFAGHVEVNEEAVIFSGEVLFGVESKPYKLVELREEWKSRVEWCDSEIQSLSREIGNLKNSLTDLNKRNELLCYHEKEVSDIENDLRLIGALSQLERNHELAREEVGLHRAELEVLSEKKSTADSDFGQARQEEVFIKGEIDRNKPRLDNVKNWIDRLSRSKSQIGENPPGEIEAWSGHEVNEGTVVELEEKVTAVNRIRQEVVLGLGGVLKDAVPEMEGAFDAIDSDAQLNRKIQDLRILFSELPHKKELHENSVHTHNTTIDNQIQELREAQDTIERFVETLNTEVDKHKVSNLEAIKLSLTLNHRFTQLMKDVDYYNLYDRNLLGVEFYDRLRTFCSEFFDGKKHTLNLEMLIDSIVYEYKHQGATNFDRKSQSGGTTSTTTALILSILLNQISPSHVSVGIPIVVDEIGTLDSSNTKTAIQTVAEHGFAVFCATPKLEPALMEGVRQWITIDRFQVNQPMVPKCHTLILPDLVERIGDVA